MRYLFSKIFLGYLLIMVLLTSLILFFAFRSIRSHYLDYIEGDLQNLNYSLKLNISDLLKEGKYRQLDSIVRKTGAEIKTRITIIAADGTVLADSKKDAEKLENHGTRPEILEAKKKGEGMSMRYSTTMGEEMLYNALAIKSNGKIIGYSRASLFLNDINSLIDDLKETIRNIIIIVVVISLFVILIFSRTLTRPIKQLALAAGKVAEGDFDTKVHLKNKDELKELADSFNYMTDHIKSLFEQISMQREEIFAIINSVPEGFLVINKEGKIIMANNGLKKIIAIKNVEGKYYRVIFDLKKINKVIKKSIKKKQNISDEIEIKDRFYLCSSSYIEPKEEIVLILYDITEMKMLEQIKKDFVTNVSHELRTPLTAIKGFLETMEDDLTGADDESLKLKRYLNIIQRHTDRLINIVQDLLALSRLEDSSSVLVLADINIKELAYNVLRIFEQKLQAKNLSFDCKAPDNLPLIKGDAFKLEQLFVNLIDNAIKYTDEGGLDINIFFKNELIHIEIEDTGIGIPQKDIDRIFERFYTVDKSRSRKLGGTGLGLSIVKHIVLLHNGEISVQSEPHRGTKFTIKLPVNLIQASVE